MDTCYFCIDGTTGLGKIMMFDLDDTLYVRDTTTKIKGMFENIKNKEADTVVVFSNQYGISKGKTSHETVMKRFEALAEDLSEIGINYAFFYSTKKDYYRKPMTGMFDVFAKYLTDDDTILFYCGDAAGRKGDFSDSDKNFAFNIGVDFITPEQFRSSRIPIPIGISIGSIPAYTDFVSSEHFILPYVNAKTVIMLVGCQACGKSKFSRELQKKNEDVCLVSQDQLGTKAKVLSTYKRYVSSGKSIIIDNTNPTRAGRKEFIDIARSHAGYYIHVIFFDFPKALSFHLDAMRTQLSHGKRELLPDVAIHTYFKRLEIPELSEGIDEITVINKLYADPEGIPDEFYYCY